MGTTLTLSAVSRFDECQMVLGDRDTFISSHGWVLEMLNNRMRIPQGPPITEDLPVLGVHRSWQLQAAH